MPPERPLYLLTLRAPPGPVPELHRLKRALKRLLREYGLTCVDLEVIREAPKEAGYGEGQASVQP